MFEEPEIPQQDELLEKLAQGVTAADAGAGLPPMPPANVVPFTEPAPVTAPLTPQNRESTLKLTPEQEAKMLDRALKRIDEIQSENGREANGQVRANSWLGRRRIYQKQYDNEFLWRESPDNIFGKSNFSPNLARANVRRLAAKVSDDLLGTEPFFATMPEQGEDAELSKQVEWFIQKKLGQSNTRAMIAEAQRRALIVNEAVVKLSYMKDSTTFWGPLKVGVGPFQYEANGQTVTVQPGEPIKTPKGEYILPLDDFNDHPDVEGMLVLEKEPTVTTRYAVDQFVDMPYVEQTLKRYEGLDVRVLEPGDFYCPLNVASVHEADCCGHFFDDPFEALKARYGNYEASQPYFTSYNSEQFQPMLDKGEEESGSEILAYVNCADHFMRCAPIEGGPEVEVWMVIDLINRKLVWYDCLGVHMSKRPFEVIPGVEKVTNRWYGMGVFELLDHKQEYIDAQFNRVNHQSSQNSSIRFINRNAIAQLKGGGQLVIGDGTMYDVTDPRYDAANPPVYEVRFNSVDPVAMELMQLMMQAAQTELGAPGPDDGAVSGLDTTKLATGIRSMERTANTLIKAIESAQASPIEAVLSQGIGLILEHMEDEELLYHPDSQALIALNRDEIRRLPKQIKLLLTRSRSSETIQNSQEVTRIVTEYYQTFNPLMQFKLRRNSIVQLRALEVQDADDLLIEVSEEEAMAWVAAQKNPPPPEPPSKSVSTKLEDYAPSEREQVVASMGIQPAPPEEVAAMEAEKNQVKAAEIALKKPAPGQVKPAATPKKPNGPKK